MVSTLGESNRKNNFAITSAGIGESLQRSASSLAAANTSLQETVALTTAANEIMQDPLKVGTSLKTISARVRGKFVPPYGERPYAV